jgi:hypothetical protein
MLIVFVGTMRVPPNRIGGVALPHPSVTLLQPNQLALASGRSRLTRRRCAGTESNPPTAAHDDSDAANDSAIILAKSTPCGRGCNHASTPMQSGSAWQWAFRCACPVILSPRGPPITQNDLQSCLMQSKSARPWTI